jgi:hypothetical protein
METEENHKEMSSWSEFNWALAEYEVGMLQLFVICPVLNIHGDMWELQKQKDVK